MNQLDITCLGLNMLLYMSLGLICSWECTFCLHMSLLYKLALGHLIPSFFVDGRRFARFEAICILHSIGNEATARIAGLIGEVRTWNVEEPQVAAEFDCHG